MNLLAQLTTNSGIKAVNNLGEELEQQIFLRTPFGMILAGVIAIFIVWLVIWWIKRYLRMSNRIPLSMQMRVFLVTVPQHIGEDEKQKRPPVKELLSQLENFYANLAMIKPYRFSNVLKNAWWNFWYGRSDHISLEMIAQHGQVSFYVAVPSHLSQYIEQQIHSQYDLASVEIADDYNIFTPMGKVFGGYLGFSRRLMFPLRTYQKFEDDPMDVLTTSLSRLPRDESAAIQIIIRPSPAGWQKYPLKVAQAMQRGKTLDQALSHVGSQGVLTSIFSSIKKQTISGATAKQDMYDQKSPRFLTPLEQELVKVLEAKASKPGFNANIRLIASAPDLDRARATFLNIFNSFGQYKSPESGNSFRKRIWVRRKRFIQDFIHRHFNEKRRMVFNTEEMISLYHFPLPETGTPNIRWLTARRVPAPTQMPAEGIVLGNSIFRGQQTVVRIKPDDRRRHVYMIGTTGTGKSVLMQEMVKQDINEGKGVCVIDPHGSLIDGIIGSIPADRQADVIYFDPSDADYPIGLNMLEADNAMEADFAIQEMIAIFYKLFPPEMIGPMFEHNMRNVMLTLIADKKDPGTIVNIPRMFTDKAYQRYKLRFVDDPMVRAFWEKEMAQTSDFHKSEMLGYLISKVGRFVENRMMRNIIGQSHSGFDFRQVMDEGKIMLINLSKGKTGEVNSNLLGLIIVSKLQMAALRRADMAESNRKDFYLYIDEFQNFITDSIATILSEARKYRLNLTLAHQYIGQLVEKNDTKIRDAVFGNVGTMVSFRVGVEDAEILAKQFEPVVKQNDLINIEKFNAYVKLLVDNSVTRAFTMQTYPPSYSDPLVAQAIREHSRTKYGRPADIVEKEIMEHSRLGSLGGSQPLPPSSK
ncbi:MAG: type IV secretion system DNA-binding domain-containing protein [Patescibacteria group bacterium]